jgi:hypothetical protein
MISFSRRWLDRRSGPLSALEKRSLPLTLPSPYWGEGRVRGKRLESLAKCKRESIWFDKTEHP